MPESALSGLVRGALAGAAGVWMIDRLDWFLYGLEPAAVRRRTEANRPEGLDPAHVLVRRARRATGRALGRPLHGAGEEHAALATHYAVGILPGALFALLRGRACWLGAGLGLPFGAGFFVAEDELANTALGTGGRPSGYPWQDHARGLAAHLMYGVVVETLLRATDRRAYRRR